MVEILGESEDEEVGSVRKKNGRSGSRIESLRTAVDELGAVHPDLLDEEKTIEGILVNQSEYEDLCKENDAFPDKGLTDGVKSGAKNRYGVKFGRKISGDANKYMVIPNDTDEDNSNFDGVMSEAQKEVDEAFAEESEEDEEDPNEEDEEDPNEEDEE